MASRQKKKIGRQQTSAFTIFKHCRFRWWLVIAVLAGGLLAGMGYYYPRYLASAPALPSPPLKELAAKHQLALGSLVKPNWLQRRPFDEILSSEFSFVTSDGELHWDKMRPAPDKFNFAPLDQIVTYAQEHNMPVQGHHLVWTEDDSLPKWLRNGNYTPTQLLDMMHQHISTVVGHYKGKIEEWTVVNEAFTREKHTYGLDNWWGDHLGGNGYIDNAFKWARAADPNAKLLLNDFNNETENGISNAMFDYIKAAKARGVPIDGIGMQMHLDAARPPSKEAMTKNMQRFAVLNVPVYVTEFDINSSTVKGSVAHKAQLEADIAADVVRACIESHNCVSLNVFGITDRNNVVSFTHSKRRSTLFTTDYHIKPAFYSFRNALQAL